MKKFYAPLKPLDFVIVPGILALIIFVYVINLKDGASAAKYLSITCPAGEYVYDLATDAVINIPGKIGITVVEIKEGSAFVRFSPCPNKTCMSQHPINNPGQWIACLPNEVILQIKSN